MNSELHYTSVAGFCEVGHGVSGRIAMRAMLVAWALRNDALERPVVIKPLWLARDSGPDDVDTTYLIAVEHCEGESEVVKPSRGFGDWTNCHTALLLLAQIVGRC